MALFFFYLRASSSSSSFTSYSSSPRYPCFPPPSHLLPPSPCFSAPPPPFPPAAIPSPTLTLAPLVLMARSLTLGSDVPLFCVKRTKKIDLVKMTRPSSITALPIEPPPPPPPPGDFKRVKNFQSRG